MNSFFHIVSSSRRRLEDASTAAVALLLGLLVFARQPGRLLHAGFWAEDGWVWYPEAYEHGWQSLLWTHTGYLQTVSRLIALIAQPLPLTWAPTVFAAAAFAVQLAVPVFLVSRRMDAAWPSRADRILFAVLYVLLPNTYETFVNLTNTQWHLAILAFLVVFARPPASRRERLSDGLVLGIASVSGPFLLFLSPIAIWIAYAGRSRAGVERALIVTGGAIVQATVLAIGLIQHRSDAPLGAGVEPFVRIIGLQWLLAAEVGLRSSRRVLVEHGAPVVALAGAMCGLAAVLAWRALAYPSPMLRAFMLYAAMILGAGLLSPMAAEDEQSWSLMARIPGMCNRYMLLPMGAWLAVVLVGLRDGRVLVRATAAVLLALMVVVGMPMDFHIRHAAPAAFHAAAAAFEVAAPGTRFAFPMAPDPNHPMVLVKR